MAREGGATASERIAYGHRLCTARGPEAADLDSLVAFFGRERARYAGDALAARALVGSEPEASQDVTQADAAALTMVANVLLNLDATLTRE